MKPHVYRARKTRLARWRLESWELRAHHSKGLGAVTILTQEEVAEVMGITRQRVQQIERNLLWKLRRGRNGNGSGSIHPTSG